MRASCCVRIDEELGGLELVEASHPRPRFGRHAHPTFAIGLVSAGANRFRYRGAWHTAGAGAVCTVTPDEPHAVEPAGDLGFAYRCLYPPRELLRSVAESVAGHRVGRTLALPPVIEDSQTARLVAAVFEAEGTARLARESHVLALLAPVARVTGLARAREYLVANLSENVSLAALATLAGLDPFALLRGFSRVYGLPPHAWLVQERVRRAQALLRKGLPAAEVAAEAGFSDQSHMSKVFRKLAGTTPKHFRDSRMNAFAGSGGFNDRKGSDRAAGE